MTKAINTYGRRLCISILLCIIVMYQLACAPFEAQEAYENGVSAYEAGNYKKALRQLNLAIRLDAENIDAYYYRGMVQEFSGKLREALKDYTKATKLDDSNADYLLRRGIVYYKIGKDKKAIADFSKAIYNYPDIPYAYLERALVRYKLGQKRSACRDWRIAHELGYDHALRIIRSLCR